MKHDIGYVVSGAITVPFFLIGMLCFLFSDPQPSLGDWGSFVAAYSAMMALLWLIIGHTANQEQIAEAKNDQLHQMKLMEELVVSLNMIAIGSKDSQEEANASMMPNFRIPRFLPLVCCLNRLRDRAGIDSRTLADRLESSV